MYGLPANTMIEAEVDDRYNNGMFTPLQAGTQVKYTVYKNLTKKEKVISVAWGYELCMQGTCRTA